LPQQIPHDLEEKWASKVFTKSPDQQCEIDTKTSESSCEKIWQICYRIGDDTGCIVDTKWDQSILFIVKVLFSNVAYN